LLAHKFIHYEQREVLCLLLVILWLQGRQIQVCEATQRAGGCSTVFDAWYGWRWKGSLPPKGQLPWSQSSHVKY